MSDDPATLHEVRDLLGRMLTLLETLIRRVDVLELESLHRHDSPRAVVLELATEEPPKNGLD